MTHRPNTMTHTREYRLLPGVVRYTFIIFGLFTTPNLCPLTQNPGDATEVIARVHSVHLVNVEQRQAAADPQTKPHNLGSESACFRQLASTTTIAIYYYSVGKLILIYRTTEGRRLS